MTEVYRLIDPYRRGYFIARDLSAMDLDEMEEAVLADIELLEDASSRSKNGRESLARRKVMLPIEPWLREAKQVSRSKRAISSSISK